MLASLMRGDDKRLQAHNNRMHSDSKKRCSCLALLFAAGDAHRYASAKEKPMYNHENRHLNIFHSYQAYHIENNVTRGLILTLKSLTPFSLRLFIQEIALKFRDKDDKVRQDNRDFDLLADPKFSFDLQPSPPSDEEKLRNDNGLLIGITYTGKQDLQINSDYLTERRGLPDGMVSENSNDISIIFESKLSDSLYGDQIQRHLTTYFEAEVNPERDNIFRETSWNNIYKVLADIHRQSTNPLEMHIIKDYLEYLDRLNLVDFVGFEISDFKNSNYTKLKKFVQTVVEQSQDLHTQLSGSGTWISFSDISPDNIWIDYRADKLLLGVVVGSGKKWRAQNFQRYLKKDRQKLKAALDRLHAELNMKNRLFFNIESTFFLSRFRTDYIWALDGDLEYPDDFDRFVGILTDPELNSFQRLDKSTINKRFKKFIDDTDAIELDSEGRFPKWKDKDEFLQYCFSDIMVELPIGKYINRKADEVVTDFVSLLKSLRTFMVELAKMSA